MSPIFRYTALLLIPFLLRGPLGAQVQPQNAASLGIHVLAKSPDQKPLDANALCVEVTDAQGAPVTGAAVIFRLPEDGPSGTFANAGRVAVVNTDSSGRAFVDGIHWTAPGTVSVRVTATKGTAHAGILIEREAAAAIPAAPVKPAPAPAPSLAAAQDPVPPKPIAPAQPAASQIPAAVEHAIEPPHVSITSVSRKQAGPAQASGTEPGVMITGAGQRSHSGSKKWIILAAVAAGAAGGAAYMLSRGKSSSSASAASSSGVSIGAPTISIGAP